jgi:ankyrin repeat protein
MTKAQNQALADAIVRGDSDAVTTVIDQGADPNASIQGTRPLHLATLIGSQQLVSLLLDKNAEPDVRDNMGRSALHYAAIGGPDHSPEIIETLVSRGGDVNARDKRGCTPLDLAAGASNQDAASVLDRFGATCRQDRRKWVQQVTGETARGGTTTTPGR